MEKGDSNIYNISSPRIGMISDTIPDEQPDNTYRMALNATTEDLHDTGAIRNEESNELCIVISPPKPKEYHIVMSNCCNENDPNNSKITTEHIVYTDETIDGIINSFSEDPGFNCGDGRVCKYFVKDSNGTSIYYSIEDIIDSLKENPRDVFVEGNCDCEKIPVVVIGCDEERYVEAFYYGDTIKYDDVIEIVQTDENIIDYITYQLSDGELHVMSEEDELTITGAIVFQIVCDNICAAINEIWFDTEITSIVINGTSYPLANDCFYFSGQNFQYNNSPDWQNYVWIAIEISDIPNFPDYNFQVISNNNITECNDITELSPNQYIIINDDNGYLYCVMILKIDNKIPQYLKIYSTYCDNQSAEFKLFFRPNTNVENGNPLYNTILFDEIIDIANEDFGFYSDSECTVPATGIVGNYFDGNEIVGYEIQTRTGENMTLTEDSIIANTPNINIIYDN